METPEDATATLLLHAATEGDVRCVRELMEANDDGSLPVYKALLLASEHGHERLVRFLLGRGADANTMSDEGRTVLEIAAAGGHTDVIRGLIEFGADVSDAGSDVWTPLVLAIENGHEETARYLVDVGADVNSTDYAGRSMLSVAVDTEQTEIVHYLVNNGAGVLIPENTFVESQPFPPADSGREPSSDIMPWPKWRLNHWDVKLYRAMYLGGNRSGLVYRGEWLKSEVAVRELAVDPKELEGIACAEKLQRFKSDAQRWFRLNHPNVVRLFGAYCDGDTPPAFVCEYAPSGSLDEFLKRHPDQLWPKLYEVALGVQHLHDRGVVLGNITCSNVVIGSDMKAKVAGFRRQHILTDTKRRADSVQWLNSEFRSDASAHPTPKSDIIALGLCVLEAMQIVKAAILDEESFVIVSTDEDKKAAPICLQQSARDASVKASVLTEDSFVIVSPYEDKEATPIGQQQSASEAFPMRQPEDCRPTTCTDDQWELIEKMCARDPSRRLKIDDVVRALERLQISRSRLRQPHQIAMTSLHTFNDGELVMRWGEAQQLMMDRALQGLQRRVFVDLLSIFARLEQTDQPRWVLEQIALLLGDFLREDRFLRCRVLNPAALTSTSSMRVFGRRITDVLGWLGLGKSHAVSSEFSYQQIDFLVSEDLPTWILLNDVTSDADYEMLHSVIKGELFGNSSRYSFDQLVIIRSAFEEINEAALLNQTNSLVLRPRWLVPQSELLFAGQSDSNVITRAKWRGADVLVNRLKRRSQSAETTTETMQLLVDKIEVWFALSHPNILRLYGACHVGDPFFVCEDAPNGMLIEYLREHPNQLWAKLRESARGLLCLHEQGIVHGNLRSSSIVVAADGVAKLTDIGFIAAVENGGDISDWRWEAPECTYRTEKTAESDVYSFGVCVAEALRAALSPVKDEKKEEEEDKKAPQSLLLDGSLDAFLDATMLPSRPKLCQDDEWELVQRMCAHDPMERIKIDAVVDAMEVLATANKPVKSEAGDEMQPTGGPRKRIRVCESSPTKPKDEESKCGL